MTHHKPGDSPFTTPKMQEIGPVYEHRWLRELWHRLRRAKPDPYDSPCDAEMAVTTGTDEEA